ncbi:hypothetical protein Tco_0955475 [Tanacetum coccineum]|uniref:Uncharacterized protein n=1 Tax=Tanacetum coccineum TaxID=301880 RepID=A0ABQ5E7C3_9ASTR
MNAYTTYPNIQGIIYLDEMNRNRLMRTDELHKFSDGTLNHHQSVKVKELQDKRILKAFKLTYQEKYEHVCPKSQDHKLERWQDDVMRLCLDQGNKSGHVDDQPDNEAAPKHDWFLTSDKPPTPDRADSRPPQKWISTIAKARQPPRTFDELMDTPIDFLTYVLNRKLSILDVDDRFGTSQNWRDLPRDIPLDSVVVLRYEKRSKSENKGKVPTEMELVLEQTQQGTSYEVSVNAEGLKN